jgi:ribosomal protein S18 acetylase RimI-like enzyme
VVTEKPSSPAQARVDIEEVDAVTSEITGALAHLVPQLSSSAPELTEADLAEIVRSPAIVLLVARRKYDGTPGPVVGSLTLVVFRAPTGPRAWIEDVVVDESERGSGVGSKLVREALLRARAAGARTVDLTSRPSRTEANRLYVRLGFEQRTTNVYRYSLEALEGG